MHRKLPRLAGEDEQVEPVRAPFPWFGGKSRAADLVWARFGNVPNYVEPFAGSLAVLLARPRGGYGSQRKDGTNQNRHRERIWFSPGCLKPSDRFDFEQPADNLYTYCARHRGVIAIGDAVKQPDDTYVCSACSAVAS